MQTLLEIVWETPIPLRKSSFPLLHSSPIFHLLTLVYHKYLSTNASYMYIEKENAYIAALHTNTFLKKKEALLQDK